MITEQQNELFDELRQIDPGIIDDGVPDEGAYLSSRYRIMYVLKEVNGGSGWSLCKHLKSGGRQRAYDPTWDNIARWTEGILSMPEEIAWSALEGGCENRREKMLTRICAINVKKTSGSYESENGKIYSEALNNANILKKQMNLYAPDLIICCGTDRAFTDACFQNEQPDWKMTSRGIRYFKYKNMSVIAFSHPAARVKDCYLYYALLDAVREILGLERWC